MLPVQKEVQQREWSEVLKGINGTLKIITAYKNVLKCQEKTLLAAFKFCVLKVNNLAALKGVENNNANIINA